MTEQDYKKLSKIAPTVAYPDAPWVTTWQDSLEMTGEALGRTEEAAKVKEETEQVIADTAEEFPQIVGKTFIFASIVTSDLVADRLLHAGGQPAAPARRARHGQRSDRGEAQQARRSSTAPPPPSGAADFESDVLLTYAMKKDDMETFENDPLIGEIPAIKSGNAYAALSTQEIYGMSGPSPVVDPGSDGGLHPERRRRGRRHQLRHPSADAVSMTATQARPVPSGSDAGGAGEPVSRGARHAGDPRGRRASRRCSSAPPPSRGAPCSTPTARTTPSPSLAGVAPWPPWWSEAHSAWRVPASRV